jgi:filamentous hemagglutinin family protein
MNSQSHKVIFSKRLGTLVAVGEHASAQGKSASGEGARGAALAAAVFLASLTSAYALDPAALPSGPTAVAGAAAIAVNGARMDITQSSDRAAINWQSFNIGTGASLHIAQPSASAVLLNRVVGNEMSQIRGQINANGQVVLVNPNGIVMGPTGRITASAFTASSFDIADADFQAGQMRFQRSATSGAVVNQGSIESTDAGGYVALIGADVNNQGTITTRQGAVVLAAADAVVMPNTPGFDTQKISVPLSRNVRLELNPAAFGPASVSNSGVIVTDGGQVLMRAAAVVDAVSKIADATVVQSGNIDTSGEQAGRVDILADDGRIRVSGSVSANSTPQPNLPTTGAGADIFIGRDELTNVLAAVGDTSGAQIESKGGFVETSGQLLKVDGARVIAKDWLLDPYNITIAASGASGTAYGSSFTSDADSVILASDISANLTAGTSVTIATGTGGASAGNIAVNESISKTGGGDATLTLQAHGNITVATNKTITSNTGKLNVLLNSDSDASGAGSIVFNSGSGVTSNGGNITLGGGSALDGSGTAVGDGVSSYAGISLTSAAFAAGGGNIAMTGTTFRNAATSTSNVHGIVVITNGSINTTGAGTISLKGYSNTITNTLSKAIQIGGATITGGSTGTVSLIGDSRSAAAAGSYLFGVNLNNNTVITSLGGNIELTGYGGNGSGADAANIGVAVNGSKVVGVGAGTVTISGTGWQQGGKGNTGVSIFGTTPPEVSSQGGDINIIGQGGNGLSSEGIAIAAGTVGVATGTTSANVILTSDSTRLQTTAINSGTGTTTIQNRTAGTLINVGGADVLNTSPLTLGITNAEMNLITAGTLKIGSTTSGAMTTSASVTTAASTGNVFLQSGSTLAASHAIASGAGLYLQTTGGALSNSAALSGTNVSLDNSNGSINLATGAITSGAGITAASNGVSISGALTATTNLNIYGASGSANGVNTSANWSGQYINAIGTTSTGYTGFSWNGGTISTTGTGGTSTASTVKGISAASTTASNGYGALMMFANGAVNSATGTALTLAGEATTLTTGQNTKERGILVQGGRTLTASGDITLDGSAKSSDGISFGGTITMATVAGVTNKLTLRGTTAASSNSALSGVNFSGVITGNASTSSINIIGEAKNLSGTNYDNAVNTSGTITGSSANVNIQGLYGKVSIDGAITGANISVDNTGGTIDATTGAITAGAGTSLYTNAVNINKALTATGNINVLGKVATTTHTGVNLTATAPITSSGAAKTINVDSTGNIANAAAIKNTGSTGTGANINITSTSGTITGAGAMGDTTNKNASVTFTHAASSTYSGAINAANFTKAGVGALTLDSWVATTPVATNISNAYTIKDGSNLTLSPGATYAALNPASVNVENASTFSINTAGNGWWKGTAFNFTGASGGGTLNLGGNPIGSIGFTNTFSTNGGATNTVTGLLNSNSGNVDFTLANATSGTALLDGSFAAIAFTQSTQGGYGLQNATTINMSGGGNLLFKDKIGATTFNINAGDVQVGDGSAAITAATATLDATNVSIAAGSKLTFNRAEAYTNASVITGAGSLIQAGAGVVTLTGNSSAFAGATTVNAGKTLAIGTGGSLGAAGSTLNLASATANVGFTNTTGTSTIGSAISGAGTLSQSGAGTGLLTSNNDYTGTTAVSGGTLQVGNAGSTGTLGTGAVTLSNNANLHYSRSAATQIFNTISGAGNLSAMITGANSDLTLSGAVNLTGGTVNLSTDANLTVSQSLSTTNFDTNAIVLNAGAATNAGTSTGGDIRFTGSGAVNVGSGGRATLFTGSVAGSTGLGITAGNSRFNSDESVENFTRALGDGKQVIYREAYALNGRIADATKIYDGQTHGNAYTYSINNGVNGDTNAHINASAFSGDAVTAVNVGTYSITASGLTSDLGYIVNDLSGQLTITPQDVTLQAVTVDNKSYDGTTQATIASSTLTGTVGSETLNVTGTANFIDANVGNAIRVDVNDLQLANGTGLASNYRLVTTSANTSAHISRRDIGLVSLTADDKTFDGTTAASITGASFSNLVAGQTLGLSGVGEFSDAAIGDNKTVNVATLSALTQTNGTGGGRWQNYNLTTSGSFTTLASIRATAPTPGPDPDSEGALPDWPKVERLNRRPADHLLAQPSHTSAYTLAQDDPESKTITVRGCGAGPTPEWRDSCLPISPSYTARYN